MAKMTLRDRIAQLITMPCYGENPRTRSQDFKRFQHWVRDLHIGGLIVVNRVVGGQVHNADPYEMAVFLNRMQKLSRVPLLVSADFERGASMRVADTVKFPHNMAYGAARDYDGTKLEAAHTAQQARAIGVHWVFAPDADVNNNPENPIINIRSYGENPADVARHVEAYIDGARSDPNNRVLVTVKHFPGHGDTATDTHMGLATLNVDRDRLNSIEWVPFRAAIEQGVDSVMTAHIALPAIEQREIPSTISDKVLTGVLRDELGFKGIIVTDAMDMQGLAKQFPGGEASVRALEAGVDVLLMPRDADQAITAILEAVRGGRITRKRIDASVAKILAAKARLGLARRRVVDVENINEVLQSPEAEARAQTTADAAVTLVRNERNVLPLHEPSKTCLIVLADNRYSQNGRQLMQEAAKRAPKMQMRLLDANAAELDVKDSVEAAASCDTVVAAAFVTASAYRGNVALPGATAEFMNRATESKTPVVFLSFGNPYLIRAFPNVAAYVAMFSTVPASETAAAKALFGEIGVTGRLPVTIPGFGKIGDGIQLTPSSSAAATR
jgi:beta-N-acetylhexosaminidase